MANIIFHKRMSIEQYNAFKTLHTNNGVLDDEFKNTLFVLNETGTFTGTDDCIFYMGEHLISYASYKKALSLSNQSTNDQFPTAKCVYDALQDAIADTSNAESITYASLKTLRDEGNLVPGKWYRITDYITTTTQTNTQSAGHVFNVIVRADSTNKLNENAYAAHHDSDTYFANCKLESWQLKYCIDNDTNRFRWADSTNGRGVIYWMKDEFDNDCPYDFKNIQFKFTSAISTSGIVANKYYYTFSVATGTNDATITDHSLNGSYCNNNKFGQYISLSKLTLPHNVFKNTSSTAGCFFNTFGNNCYNNTFRHSCQCNTFGYNCYNNTFGNSCNYNTFGNSCNYNTFGNNCGNNTFGNECNNITFSKDYTYYCIVENGNRYITLTSTQTTSSSNKLRNITIAQGVNNTNTTKTISHNTVNDAFQTVYGIDSSGTLVAWNDADGANMLSKIKSVTYSELVSLRDNSQLVAGQQYRITDYHCVTTQINTRSTDHQFDIIVTATSENKLNENAKAINHIFGDEVYLTLQNGSNTFTYPSFMSALPISEALGFKFIPTRGDTISDGTLIAAYEVYYDNVTGTNILNWHGNLETLQPGIEYTYTYSDQNSQKITFNTDYFRNSDLDAWKIWYHLDNNDGIYTWADTSIQTIKMDTDGDGIGAKLERDPENDLTNVDINNSFVAPILYAWKVIDIGTGDDEYPTDWETGDLIPAYSMDEYLAPGSPIIWNDFGWDCHYIIYSATELETHHDVTKETPSYGVIYRMIDEFGNDCPYDFKNIQFKRWKTDYNENDYFGTINSIDFTGDLCSSGDVVKRGYSGGYNIPNIFDYCWFYTFTPGLSSTDTIDTSLNFDSNNECKNNIIKSCVDIEWQYQNYSSDRYGPKTIDSSKYILNNNIIFGSGNSCFCSDNCYNNTIQLSNSLGSYNNFNTLLSRNNTLKNNCYYNFVDGSNGFDTYHGYLEGNTLDNGCINNILKGNTSNNEYHCYGHSNYLGAACKNNTLINCQCCSIGSWGEYNTLGNDSGGDVEYIIIGPRCRNNWISRGYDSTIGSELYYSTISIYYSSIGECCHHLTIAGARSTNIGNNCNNIHLPISGTSNVNIEEGNQYITLTSTQQISSGDELRNITIAQGVNNTTSDKTINHNTVNDTFQTIYANDASGNLKSWVSADIVKNSGDTMTGALILHDHPNASSPVKQAATKGYVDDAITALPSPMVFKGTATITKSGNNYTVTVSDPATASNIKKGYTYKITSVPTDDTNFKSGDTLIAKIDNPGNNPQNQTNWALIPSGDDVEDTWRNINVNGTQLLGNGISTGALNLKSGNNISVVGSGNDVTIDIPQTATPSVTSVEASYSDTTNNLSGYRGMLAKKKVYTGVLGVANGSSPNNNTFANRGVYFITLYPRDWNSQWTIHYHLNVHLDNENQLYKSSSTASVINVGQLERGTYDCILSGTSSIYTVFHMFQSQKNTSYRPIYYHMLHGPNANGNAAGKGYKIGVNFHSSYLPVPTADWSTGSSVLTNFGRTIEVVIDECINCTAELNDTLEVEADAYRTDYVKLDSSYYTTNTSDSNTAGRYSLIAATSQGLYESGDNDTYSYTQQSSNYLKNGTHYNDNSAGYFLGYNLLGFDKDGKALAISKSTPTTTAYTTAVYTNRVYCDVGFDYKKGIRYYSGSGNYGEGVDMNISTQINYSGLDLRYSDNCVASTGAQNTLGMVNREPVYLRGTIGNDGLFYVAPIEVTYNNATYKRAWVQPGDATRLTTNPFDTSHVYWFIGYPQYSSSYANSLYLLCLISTGGLSYYDGTQLKPYTNDKPVLANGTTANTIKVTVGGQTSADYTVPYATQAGTATHIGSSSVGSTSLPVYINNGTPTQISSLALNTGNISTTSGNISVGGTSALTGKVTTTNDIEVGTDLRVKGNDIYVGTASNAQCHIQYDSTEECINFIFD